MDNQKARSKRNDVVVDEKVMDSATNTIEDMADDAKPLFGVVTDCTRLNIRREPRKDSKRICAVNALTELTIDQDKSTDEWFKVYTADGIEGFCMTKYIAVKQ